MKVIGKNFLHTHPRDEIALNLDEDHCIVDKKDLQTIYKFFENNPELIPWIDKDTIHWDRNTNKPFNIE